MNLKYNNFINLSVVKENEKRKILYGRSPESGLTKYSHSKNENSNNNNNSSNGSILAIPKKKPPVGDQNHNSKEILKTVFGILAGVIALLIIFYIIYLVISIIMTKKKERRNNKVNTENSSLESSNNPNPNPNPNPSLIDGREVPNPSTQNIPYQSLSIQPNTDTNTNMDSLSQTYQPNGTYPSSIYSITYCQTCYVPQVYNCPVVHPRYFPRQTYSAPYRPKSCQGYPLVPQKISIPSINNYVNKTSFTKASNLQNSFI